MDYTERQKLIIEMLKNGSMSIADISEMLYVSQMTIRRDVLNLKRLGIVTQFRGGVALNNESVIVPIDLRENNDKNEKILLAKKAIKYVRDGTLIFIDSSSTCYNIVPLLVGFKNIQVITNSTKAILELGRLGIRSKMVCGNLVPKDKCVVGSDAEGYIRKFMFDIAFISASGYDNKRITDWSESQTNVRKAAIDSSERTYCLMLHSKYNVNYQYVVCETRNVGIITVDE